MRLTSCHGIVCGAAACGWSNLEIEEMLTVGGMVQDNLRDSEVVPHFGGLFDRMSCAEERRELEILAR